MSIYTFAPTVTVEALKEYYGTSFKEVKAIVGVKASSWVDLAGKIEAMRGDAMRPINVEIQGQVGQSQDDDDSLSVKQKTIGQVEQKTIGQVKQKTIGQVEQKTIGQVEQKTIGQVEPLYEYGEEIEDHLEQTPPFAALSDSWVGDSEILDDQCRTIGVVESLYEYGEFGEEGWEEETEEVEGSLEQVPSSAVFLVGCFVTVLWVFVTVLWVVLFGFSNLCRVIADSVQAQMGDYELDRFGVGWAWFRFRFGLDQVWNRMVTLGWAWFRFRFGLDQVWNRMVTLGWLGFGLGLG
jgi:hypothetical protein